MAESSNAVFLSYASQDVAAAQRIADALRAAGLEVWFDQSELVGGDAWDAKIRRQIAACALFVPVISANTQARLEGYFRIEWKLAAQRTHAMADEKTFLLPVVIDDTRDADAKVPAEFKVVQWSRLPGGEESGRFCARVKALLAGSAGVTPASPQTAGGTPVLPERARGSPAWLTALIVLVPTCAGLYFAWRVLPFARSPAPANKVAAANPTPAATGAATPQSEARQLAAKARALFNAVDATREDHQVAEQWIQKALAKDPTDAEVVATEAQLHYRYIIRGWDESDARRDAARAAAQKALRLDPLSLEARYANAAQFAFSGKEAEEKEQKLRALHAEYPKEGRVTMLLAETIERRDSNRIDEACALFDEAAALPGAGPLAFYNKSLALWFAGRTADAETALAATLHRNPFMGARLLKVWYALILHGDVATARATIEDLPAQMLQDDRAGFFAFAVEIDDRRFAAARARLAAVPRDWLNDGWFRGPKGRLVGDAYAAEGKSEAARLEWQAALKLVDAQLATAANDRLLLCHRVVLLAHLGQKAEAERQAAVLEQVGGFSFSSDNWVPSWITDMCVALGRNADAIRQIRASLKATRRAVDHTSWTLKLNPGWDPLRGDPEFAKVIAEAEAMERTAAMRK